MKNNFAFSRRLKVHPFSLSLNYFVLAIIIFLFINLCESQPNRKSPSTRTEVVSNIEVTLAPGDFPAKDVLWNNGSYLSFIGNKAHVQFRCSGSLPTTWEFYMDKGADTSWSDIFFYSSERKFSDFYNISTYKYYSVLDFHLHKGQIVKGWTCWSIPDTTEPTVNREVLKGGNYTVVSRDYDYHDYKIDPTAKPSLPPKSFEGRILSKTCDVIHYVKELTPTSLAWYCQIPDDKNENWGYSNLYSCHSIPECTHPFHGARNQETCMKFLGPEEPCSSCTVTESITSAIMYCNSRYAQRYIPLVYSIKHFGGLPKRYYRWSWKEEELQAMMDFEYIPSLIHPDDFLILKCKVSETYFALGTKFAVKYKFSQRLHFLEGEISTYIEEYNRRDYTIQFQWNFNSTSIEKIYCFAPLWNSSQWINQSQYVIFQEKRNGKFGQPRCKLYDHTPSISIIPNSPAVFSTPEILVFSDKNGEFNFTLNCLFNEPVKWYFERNEFHDELISTQIIEEQTFLTSIRLAYKRIPHHSSFRYNCESTSNECKRSTIQVGVSSTPDKNIIVAKQSISDLTIRNAQGRCRAIFTIKPISNESFGWECGSSRGDLQLVRSEYSCRDPRFCATFFEGAIQDDNCLKLLSPDEKCSNCRSSPNPIEGPYYPRYLDCGSDIKHMRSYQFAFFSVEKYNGVRKMFFRINDADPSTMMDLSYNYPTPQHSLDNIMKASKTLQIMCRVSNFYFDKGATIILTSGGGQRFSFNDSEAIIEEQEDVRKIVKTLNSSELGFGLVNITCSAPSISNQTWVSKSISFELMDQITIPQFKRNLTHAVYELNVGDSIVLDCDIKNYSRTITNVSWRLPNESLIVRIETDRSNGIYRLHLNNITEQYSGFYTCTAHQNESDEIHRTLEINVRLLSDPSQNETGIEIFIAAGIVGVLLTAMFVIIILIFCYIRTLRNNLSNFFPKMKAKLSE